MSDAQFESLKVRLNAIIWLLAIIVLHSFGVK